MRKSIKEILLFLVQGFPVKEKMEVIRVINLSGNTNQYRGQLKNGVSRGQLTNQH